MFLISRSSVLKFVAPIFTPLNEMENNFSKLKIRVFDKILNNIWIYTGRCYLKYLLP